MLTDASVVLMFTSLAFTVTLSDTDPISSAKFCSNLSWTNSWNSLMAISLKPSLRTMR